jgi:acylglycerol lipase
MQTDTFTSNLDRTPIAFRIFRPDAAPRAVVAISHGFKAHGGLYGWTGEELVKNGFAAYAIDHRGHGNSGGERYEAGDVAEFLSDLDQFIDIVRQREPGVPVFLLGHSAGGVMGALYCLDHQDKLAGFICESYAFGVYAPELAVAALKGLSHIAPHLHVLDLKNELFSRDPAVVAALDHDPLIPNMRYPARTVVAMVRGTERLAAEFATITLPLFILHGSADRVTEPAGSERFYREAGSKDKRLEIYQDYFHDLLADTGRERPMGDILQWIRARLPAA